MEKKTQSIYRMFRVLTKLTQVPCAKIEIKDATLTFCGFNIIRIQDTIHE